MLPWGTNPAPFEFPIRTQRFSPFEQKGTFIPHLKGSWDPHVGKQKTCYSVWPAVWVGKNRTPFLDCHSSLMTLQPQGESCCWNPSVVLLATCAEYAFHFSGGTILWLKPTVGWESSMFFGSSHHDCVVTFVFLCVKIKKSGSSHVSELPSWFVRIEIPCCDASNFNWPSLTVFVSLIKLPYLKPLNN